jgi:ribonuclease-3
MGLKRPTGEALAEALRERTGHSFRDHALLQTALTHSSAARALTNNERLEFLGDRILALIVSEMLFQAFPDAPEGELAVRLSALVSGQTCAEVGLELGLDAFMRADAALRPPKGRKGTNVLADAVEALIAAIYLEGGLDAARGFVLRYWQPRSAAVPHVPRDPKTELQEWAVQAAGARPVYTIEKREGPDHEPVFTVLVDIAGFAPSRASGRSKQVAERAAASAFLTREGIWPAERQAS